MSVEVKTIKQVVQVVDQGATVDVLTTKPQVSVTAVGPQGPKGDDSNGKLGGYVVNLTNPQNLDVLQFQSQEWVNNPQANLTDGGNF